ncbi:MAG: hypothetical protein ACJ72W_02665 [Actinoallomurus sp.]
MIRNFALTFGALSSRIWQPIVVLIILAEPNPGNEQVISHDIAGTSAWLGFTVNMVIAEHYLQRRYGVSPVRRPAKPATDTEFPLAALALIVGIDRILNEGRVFINVLGNAVAAIVVGK